MPIASPLRIEKLELSNGIRPFDEWFDTLSIEDQMMVDDRIERVRRGNFGEFENVGGGVGELKFRRGRAIRIYYGRMGLTLVLLIMGGDKRTQKNDIRTAISLFARYREVNR